MLPTTLSALTGLAVTGLTSPTFTGTLDASEPNKRRFLITTLGGTQPSVTPHTVSDPYFVEVFRPAVFAMTPPVDPRSGLFSRKPGFNLYGLLTETFAIPASGQVALPFRVLTTFKVPAGVETYDANTVASGLSLHSGILSDATWRGALFSMLKTGEM